MLRRRGEDKGLWKPADHPTRQSQGLSRKERNEERRKKRGGEKKKKR